MTKKNKLRDICNLPLILGIAGCSLLTILLLPLIQYLSPKIITWWHKYLSPLPIPYGMVVVVTVCLIAVFNWKNISSFCKKYNNTKNSYTERTYFLLDVLFWYFTFCTLLSVIFTSISFDQTITFQEISFFATWIIAVVILCVRLAGSRISASEKSLTISCKCHDHNEAISPLSLLQSDIPSHYTKDVIGRDALITRLYKYITDLQGPFLAKGSFVIGLQGEWGEGKTFIIEKLCCKIKKETDESFFILRMSPWNYYNSPTHNGFWQGFYRDLEAKISSEFIIPELHGLIKKYYKQIEGSKIKLGVFSYDIPKSKEDDLGKVKERIAKIIKNTGKTILVVLDDIDRLPKEEILRVFQLVKAHADFPHMVFLLAYDLVRVRKQLEKTMGSDYIEKIVQWQVQLPLFFTDNITSYTLSCLSEESEELKIAFTWALSQEAVQRKITNIRQAKRLLNGVLPFYSTLKDEVDWEDFIILEIIRQHYPLLYQDINNNPTGYMAYANQMLFFRNEEERCKYINTKTEKDNNALMLLRVLFSAVDKAFHSIKNDQKHIRTITEDTSQSIRYAEYFLKYLFFGIPENELSDEDIEQKLTQWTEKLSQEEETLKQEIHIYFTEALNDKQRYSLLSRLFPELHIRTNQRWQDKIDLLKPLLLREIYSHESYYSNKRFHTPLIRFIDQLLNKLHTKGTDNFFSELCSIIENLSPKSASEFLIGYWPTLSPEQQNNIGILWLKNIQNTVKKEELEYHIQYFYNADNFLRSDNPTLLQFFNSQRNIFPISRDLLEVFIKNKNRFRDEEQSILERIEKTFVWERL